MKIVGTDNRSFDVKEIVYITELKDFKIAFKDVYPNKESALKENTIEYLDVYRYAVVKTTDDKIRECISYLDFETFVWMDLETDRDYYIFNYDKYLNTMKTLNETPSDFIVFVKERHDGLCDLSRRMKINMS